MSFHTKLEGEMATKNFNSWVELNNSAHLHALKKEKQLTLLESKMFLSDIC